MKKISVLFICSLLFMVFSDAFAQTTFKNIVAAKRSYQTVGIDQSQNRDYFVSMLMTDDKGHNTYCARIGNNGKILWEKVYNSNKPQTTTKLAATSDNGVVIFVQGDPTSGTVIKCDSSGNIQWAKRFIIMDTAVLADRPELFPVAIIEDSKGNYVLLYQLFFRIIGRADEIRVHKFDRSGNLIFRSGVSNIYDVHNAQYLHVRSLAEALDGNLLIGFSYQPCAICEYGTKPFLITMNQEGDVISYRQAPLVFSYNDGADPISIFTKKDKQYILEAYWDYKNDKWFWYFIELNANGDFVEAKFLPHDLFALQRFAKKRELEISDFQSFMVNKNRIINITYHPRKTRNNETAIITKYDSLGRICPDFINPQFPKNISDTGFVFGNEITRAKKITDSLFVGDAGMTAYDTFLMRTNCSAKAADIETISEIENNSFEVVNAKLYPNPARNFITLSLQSDKEQQAQIELFNVDGKIVRSFTMNVVAGKNVKKLDVSFLAKGVYLVKVSESGKQRILKFLKE